MRNNHLDKQAFCKMAVAIATPGVEKVDLGHKYIYIHYEGKRKAITEGSYLLVLMSNNQKIFYNLEDDYEYVAVYSPGQKPFFIRVNNGKADFVV